MTGPWYLTTAMLSTSTGCSQGGGPSLVSEAESSDMAGPDCFFSSADWKALNLRRFGGGSVGEAGEEGEYSESVGGCEWI